MKDITLNIFSYFMFTFFIIQASVTFATQTHHIYQPAEYMIENGTQKYIGLEQDRLKPVSFESMHQVKKDGFIFTWTKDNKDNIYFGTGNAAKLYQINPKGIVNFIQAFDGFLFVSSVVYWNGYLYVALNPKGTIVQIDLDRFEIVHTWSTKEQYIWNMLVDDNNRLFVATGLNAHIYEITKPDLTEQKLIYKSNKEDHFLALTTDGTSNLYFGGSQQGVVYRHDLKKDKTQAIYQVEEGEIKEIAFRKTDKSLFVATAGFNISQQLKLPKHKQKEQNSASKSEKEFQPNHSSLSQNLYKYTSYFPFLNRGRQSNPKSNQKNGFIYFPKKFYNTVYQFDSTGKKTVLTQQLNTLFLSLAIHQNGDVFIGSDKKAIIYKNDSKQLIELPDLEVLSLKFIDENTLIATTGIQGGIYKIHLKGQKKGEYISKVIQANNIIYFGKMKLNPLPEKNKVKIYTRSGNTKVPDNTWSPWEIVSAENNFQIQSPPAMNLQYKIELIQSTASVKYVKIFYRFKNRAPVIEKATINQQSPYKLPDSFVKLLEKLPWMPSLYLLEWKASDPDEDTLTYTIQFKENTSKATWTTIKEDQLETNLLLDTSKIPDGEYLFAITASDISHNTDDALTHVKKSPPIYVDNTAPVFETVDLKEEKDTISIQFTVTDNSILKACGFSLNLSDWNFIYPKSGLYDSKLSQFSIEIKKSDLEESNNTIILQAVDNLFNKSRYILKIDDKLKD